MITAVASASRKWAADEGVAQMLVSHFFMQEVLAVAQAGLVVPRLPVAYPVNGRLSEAIKEGRPPEPSPYIRYLRRGLPNRPRWHQLIRPLAGKIRGQQLSYSRTTARALRRDVITVTYDKLVIQHAKNTDKKVIYSPISDWFDSLDSSGIERSMNKVEASVATEGFVTSATAVLRELDFELSFDITPYLRQYLVGLAAAIDGHLSKLLASPHKIPRDIWTGTGGILWSRTLRHASKVLGGAATGHDHAEGHGHFSTDTRPLFEFPAVDRFFTFNQVQVDAMKKHLWREILVTDNVPELDSVEQSGTEPDQSHPAKSARVLRVMYMATSYIGERTLLTPLVPDLVMVDWQARLFSMLRNEGHKVHFKLHPGSSMLPPSELLNLCDEVVTEPFEEVFNQADVFLFDMPQSTTFGTALRRTSTPVVIIDLGIDKWDQQALGLAEKRCSLVQSSFDQDGRIQVSRTELSEGIQSSLAKNDPNFANTYLSFGR